MAKSPSGHGGLTCERDHKNTLSSLGRIEGQLATVTEILTGNGDPGKGMIVRLANIEIKVKWLWLALVSTVGASSAFVWHAITQLQ